MTKTIPKVLALPQDCSFDFYVDFAMLHGMCIGNCVERQTLSRPISGTNTPQSATSFPGSEREKDPGRVWSRGRWQFIQWREGRLSKNFVYTETTGVRNVLSPKQTKFHMLRYANICSFAAMSGDNSLQTPKKTYTSSVISCCRSLWRRANARNVSF